LTLISLACDWLACALAAAGIIYTVVSGLFIRRFFAPGRTPPAAPAFGVQEGATILKPLHGAEPSLRRNLESFVLQNDAGPLQVVLGLHSARDPALGIAQSVQRDHPDRAVLIETDARLHGQNRKISNVINMMPAASHPIVILSDSDIGAKPDYLRQIRAALAQPSVGVVSCPYYGEGRSGFWSDIAAMGLSYQFLPDVIAGVSLGMATPCMGSTIALRRETLGRIGGFEAFSDVLADDYAIGDAVRGLGLKSVVAPVLVVHGCTEKHFDETFSHELRWAKTVKGVDPLGHLGSVVTHPLPLALLAALFTDFHAPSLVLIAVAFAARVWLMSTVDRVIGRPLGRWWLMPMRDMLSFFVFVGSFFVRSVEWRGMKFHVSENGDLKPV